MTTAIRREALPDEEAISHEEAGRFAAILDTVRHTETGSHHLSVIVPDIRCANCALSIEKKLSQMAGVDRCLTSLADHRVIVEYSDVMPEKILQAINNLGYTPLPDRQDQLLASYQQEKRKMLVRIGIAGIGMMQVMMYAMAEYLSGSDGVGVQIEGLMRWASLLITTPVALYSAAPFHLRAFQDIKNRMAGMDVPVSVAILSAWLLSLYGTLVQADHVYFDSVCMFTFFLLTGRFLELNSRHRYQQAESLSDSLLPDVVRLVNLSGKESLVALENVRQGDRIRVSSGEVIGADGCVLEGVSHIDEAAFTGESLPVLRRPGQAVFAGGKNLDVDILVEVAGEKSSWVISRISESFREAVNYKPAFSVLADRVARYFVTGVLGLAFISGFFWYLSGAENWFVVSLTVLVVSCPCALSLATPIAYTLAAAVLRNAGVVLSNGAFLERLTEVNTVVFDKTGTLTTGEMALAETRVLGGASGENLIEIASVLEKGSLHPVARAFGTVGDLTVSERASVPGEGVAGVIGGRRYRLGSPLFAAGEALQLPDESHYWILLGSEKPLCWFGFHDRLRAEAGTVIDSLNNLGMENLLYTGDASARVEKLAREAGVEGYKKGLSPEEKMSAIMSLQKDGKKILMVGDGVNDTGAMRVADASISVSPVDAFVQSSADATLLGGNLDAIPMLIRYAGRVRRVIRQNIIWALVYNFSVIPLAVVGILQPWMAALGMSLSSLLVVLNANRVYRLK